MGYALSHNRCGPCKQIAPAVVSLSAKYSAAVFLKVDVDVLRNTARRYEVSSYPTFLFFKDAKKIHMVRCGCVIAAMSLHCWLYPLSHFSPLTLRKIPLSIYFSQFFACLSLYCSPSPPLPPNSSPLPPIPLIPLLSQFPSLLSAITFYHAPLLPSPRLPITHPYCHHLAFLSRTPTAITSPSYHAPLLPSPRLPITHPYCHHLTFLSRTPTAITLPSYHAPLLPPPSLFSLSRTPTAPPSPPPYHAPLLPPPSLSLSRTPTATPFPLLPITHPYCHPLPSPPYHAPLLPPPSLSSLSRTPTATPFPLLPITHPYCLLPSYRSKVLMLQHWSQPSCNTRIPLKVGRQEGPPAHYQYQDR